MNKIETIFVKTDIFRKSFFDFKNFYLDLIKQLEIDSKKYPSVFVYVFTTELKKMINDDTFWKENKDKKLFGIPFTLKDNFLLKGYECGGGSKTLDGYQAVADATVYCFLRDAGAVIIAKTSLDELGLGGTGLYAKEGPVYNLRNPKHIIGGSSSGSALSIMLGLADFSIVTDTGDSARACPAYGGFCGFKPSFGAISRFGMLQYAPSLDTVGILTKNTRAFEKILEVLSGPDEKDGAIHPNLLENNIVLKKPRIGYLKMKDSNIDNETSALFQTNVIDKFASSEFCYKEIVVDNEKVALLALLYKILSFSEAISTQYTLTGLHFGADPAANETDFNKRVTKNRDSGFGEEIKRRYTIGAYFSSENFALYAYKKANLIRIELVNYFNSLWKDFDFLFHPANHSIAPTVASVHENRKNPKWNAPIVNDMMLIANFTGSPTIVLPYARKDGLSLAVNIFAPINKDYQLINFCKKFEEILDFKKK